MTRRVLARIAILLLVASGVAACDKCGDRVHFNAPEAPLKFCGSNVDPAR